MAQQQSHVDPFEHYDLSTNSWVRLFPAWLPAPTADELMTSLLTELTFEQREVVLFGKRIPQPRLIAWCGSPAYRYSGLTLSPAPIPPCLEHVVSRVSQQVGVPFNHILANLYRDGSDSMGLHADDERELGCAPVVSCLSLGACRSFVVRARKGNRTLKLALAAGSLLIMGGDCQHEFVHGIPKTKGPVGQRLSLTFRRIAA